VAIGGESGLMARNDGYQEISGLRVENAPVFAAYLLTSRMGIFAGVFRTALVVIDCALRCCRSDGPSSGAVKSLRRASDSENVHVFQIHQNHDDAWFSPQLEYLNSSVPEIVFAVGVGIESVASCPAVTM
jgi:hypothetical protein